MSSLASACLLVFLFFFSSRRRHTRWPRDWSSDVCSSDLRTIKELVDAGHLIKVQVPKPGGGFLNAYDVDTNIIYRTSSFLRRVRKQVEHASTMRKANGDAGSGCRCGGGSKGFKSKNNNKYKRKRNRRSEEGRGGEE